MQEQAVFYAYLQPGMTRVIQAAGRLIRSETDRGVIALICQRFLQEPYASHLPRDWFKNLPGELFAQNPAEEIREFFGHSEKNLAQKTFLKTATRLDAGSSLVEARNIL